jgi:hypothetical protein
VNAVASQTNRLVTSLASPAAAIALVGTNVLLPAYGLTTREAELPSYGQSTIYPSEISTSVAVSRMRSEVSEATRAFVQAGIRWSSYITRRLAALRMSGNDFTGLKVPSPWIVDRAWAVANSYFRPNTPPPSVVPTEDGDILFIWRKAGWELHIEISSEEATAWAYNRKSGRSWSGSLGERQPEFYTLLDLLGQS